jgi:hypothetical protein
MVRQNNKNYKKELLRYALISGLLSPILYILYRLAHLIILKWAAITFILPISSLLFLSILTFLSNYRYKYKLIYNENTSYDLDIVSWLESFLIKPGGKINISDKEYPTGALNFDDGNDKIYIYYGREWYKIKISPFPSYEKWNKLIDLLRTDKFIRFEKIKKYGVDSVIGFAVAVCIILFLSELWDYWWIGFILIFGAEGVRIFAESEAESRPVIICALTEDAKDFIKKNGDHYLIWAKKINEEHKNYFASSDLKEAWEEAKDKSSKRE